MLGLLININYHQNSHFKCSLLGSFKAIYELCPLAQNETKFQKVYFFLATISLLVPKAVAGLEPYTLG
jgi:hypothetical protein